MGEFYVAEAGRRRGAQSDPTPVTYEVMVVVGVHTHVADRTLVITIDRGTPSGVENWSAVRSE